MSDVIQMLTMATIAFGLMLSLRLLIFRNRVSSSIYLSLYVLILVGAASEIFFRGKWQLVLIGASYWAVGPLVYFFIQSKVENRSAFSMRTLYHLIPLLVYSVLLLLNRMPAGVANDGLLDLVLYEILFIHILTYFIISAKLLAKKAHLIPRRDVVGKMDYSFSFFLPYASFALFGMPFLLTNLQVFVLPAFPMQSFLPLIQIMLIFFILIVAFLNTQHMSTLKQPNK